MIVELKKDGIDPVAHEGLSAGTWVCVDYLDVIIHLMRPEERSFYGLESIWGGCKKI